MLLLKLLRGKRDEKELIDFNLYINSMNYLFHRIKLRFRVQSYPSVKNLCVPIISSAGRNNTGKISFRAVGKRVSRKYRLVDFKRLVWNYPGKVLRIEYDPNRTSLIALICYPNGVLSYINATDGLYIGQRIFVSAFKQYLKLGNTLPMYIFNEGSVVNTVEFNAFNGGVLARSAGTAVTLLKKLPKNQILAKLPSKEEVLLDGNCLATYGRVSNLDRKFSSYYKAGQLVNFGVKPKVRGVAKNPIDHPHGGGGGRCLVTPWAQIAKNRRTRNKKKVSPQIVRSRRLFIRKVFVKKLKKKSKRLSKDLK